jgi:hypothetical protein
MLNFKSSTLIFAIETPADEIAFTDRTIGSLYEGRAQKSNDYRRELQSHPACEPASGPKNADLVVNAYSIKKPQSTPTAIRLRSAEGLTDALFGTGRSGVPFQFRPVLERA